jgi:hypothetical protein
MRILLFIADCLLALLFYHSSSSILKKYLSIKREIDTHSKVNRITPSLPLLSFATIDSHEAGAEDCGRDARALRHFKMILVSNQLA